MTNLSERTVNLVLDRGRFGNRRKAKLTKLDLSDTDANMLRLNKTLLKSPELKAIIKTDREVLDFLYETGIPSPLYKQSVYIIPLGIVSKVRDELTERKELWKAQVEAFLKAYPEQALAASESLGRFYNASDYPSVEEIRERFHFDWRIVAETTPTQLADISAQFFEEERTKAEALMANAVEEVRQYLRESLKAIVDHMADRLTDTVPGKRNIFKSSITKNLDAFLSTFTIRNVTDDTELSLLVSELRSLTAGVTPTTLRDDDALRSHIATRLTEVKSSLDSMVVTSSDRAISLDY
jgi:hypothetical protein